MPSQDGFLLRWLSGDSATHAPRLSDSHPRVTVDALPPLRY